MSHLAESSSYLSSLRERATGQLTGGVRSDLARTSTSEAMAVLYKLASLPSTAGDALALLHELQVHQVEVDMQHEELRHSRADLENHLARQTNLVERAPAAFLVIDETTVVCEINRAGVRLLGAAGQHHLHRRQDRELRRVLGMSARSRPRALSIRICPRAQRRRNRGDSTGRGEHQMGNRRAKLLEGS